MPKRWLREAPAFEPRPVDGQPRWQQCGRNGPCRTAPGQLKRCCAAFRYVEVLPAYVVSGYGGQVSCPWAVVALEVRRSSSWRAIRFGVEIVGKGRDTLPKKKLLRDVPTFAFEEWVGFGWHLRYSTS